MLETLAVQLLIRAFSPRGVDGSAALAETADVTAHYYTIFLTVSLSPS